jgi:hypothetical protein
MEGLEYVTVLGCRVHTYDFLCSVYIRDARLMSGRTSGEATLCHFNLNLDDHLAVIATP